MTVQQAMYLHCVIYIYTQKKTEGAFQFAVICCHLLFIPSNKIFRIIPNKTPLINQKMWNEVSTGWLIAVL